MKIEPAIDPPSLITRLTEIYGLPAVSLTFVPVGEASIAYVVDFADGVRYFLKLWPDTRQGRALRTRLDAVLSITRELYDRDLFRDLPYPIPTTEGTLIADFDTYTLALFPYIEGQTLDRYDVAAHPLLDELDVVDQLARAMAKVHQATSVLNSPLPRASAFEMNFAADLRRGLTALDHIGQHHRQSQIALRDLLVPRCDDLLSVLTETEQMAEIVARGADRLVLCHTDMGGGNSIVDAGGKVWVLDWDDIILAPAEHDLQEFRRWHFERFVQTYLRAGRVAALDSTQFDFYLRRRYLADLTDWLIRILEENTDPMQDASDLAGIADYSLAGLDNIDTEVGTIKQTLVGVAGGPA